MAPQAGRTGLTAPTPGEELQPEDGAIADLGVRGTDLKVAEEMAQLVQLANAFPFGPFPFSNADGRIAPKPPLLVDAPAEGIIVSPVFLFRLGEQLFQPMQADSPLPDLRHQAKATAPDDAPADSRSSAVPIGRPTELFEVHGASC